MASPALQQAGADIEVVGVPGVTAALAAAALLGAPLGHDHVLISLSDLHTPWPVIERRVAAAAAADLVTCFYNPRSRDRHWQLGAALDALRAHRPPDTPVGAVRQAGRPGQRVWTAPLAAFDPAEVDMLTTVVVGSERDPDGGRADGDPARLPLDGYTAAVRRPGPPAGAGVRASRPASRGRPYGR